MKKNFLFTALLLITIFLAAGCNGRSSEFGYVDMQRVMQESSKVKELQEKMDKKVKEFSEADAKEKTSLSDEEFAKNQQLRQAEMMTFGRDVENQFKTLLDKAMDEVAKEKKIGAVLTKGSVLQGGVDVTDDLLKKIN